MANSLYVNYKNLLLGNGVHALPDWDTDTIDAILIDSASYTPNLATHQDRADISGGARTATETILTPSIAAGAVDAPDLTLPSVTGAQSEYIAYVLNTGTEANDTLIALLDTFPAGMPVTPNGGDIVLVFDAAGLLGF